MQENTQIETSSRKYQQRIWKLTASLLINAEPHQEKLGSIIIMINDFMVYDHLKIDRLHRNYNIEMF